MMPGDFRFSFLHRLATPGLRRATIQHALRGGLGAAGRSGSDPMGKWIATGTLAE